MATTKQSAAKKSATKKSTTKKSTAMILRAPPASMNPLLAPQVIASRADIEGWLEESSPAISYESHKGQRLRTANWPIVHWAEGECERILSGWRPSEDASKADEALMAMVSRLEADIEDTIPPSVLLAASPSVLVPNWNRHALMLVLLSYEGDRALEPNQVLMLLARHGNAMVPGLLLCSTQVLERDRVLARQRLELMEKLGLALLHVEHPDAALAMSALAWSSADPMPPGIEAGLDGAAIGRSPWWRLGRRWLLRFPEAAARGLFTPALAENNPHAALARAGLTVLGQSIEGRRAILGEADRLGDDAIPAARRLLKQPFIPGKSKASNSQLLPSDWRPSSLPRPVLTGSGMALPNEAITALALALTQTSNLVQHPLVGRALRECTRPSLADFAWAILQQAIEKEGQGTGKWSLARKQSIKSGGLSNPSHAWMLSALSWLGDDRCAERLTSLIREWPRSNYLVRALRGLEILGDIGTDGALAHLQSLTLRNRYTPVLAATVLEALAAERGLTRDQLDDRSVPDLGLDSRSEIRFEVGGSEIVVAIDESFTPRFRVADAKPATKWPKMVQGSDAGQLKSATEEWKNLAADLKITSGLQMARLERAMVSGRTWSVHDFLRYCVQQPLLRVPVRGLVWGVSSVLKNAPLTAFAVAGDDCAFEDVLGKRIELAPDGTVQLMHPIHLGADLSMWLARWQALGRAQPIIQLARKVYRAEDDQASTLFGLRGARIPSGAFRGLSSLGWHRVMAGTAGWLEGFRKAADAGWVYISVEPGIHIDSPEFEETHQTLSIDDLPPLSELEFSEIVRELQTLRQ